jgi:hypothetical protein
MKAIAMLETNIHEISREVNRKKLKEIKFVTKVAEKYRYPFYFIPYYEFPLTAGIPRKFIVSESHMARYFEVDYFYPDGSYWMHISPKRSPAH